MNTMYVVCLVAVSIHVIALPAFFWSLRRREFRESDRDAFRAVQDDESAPAPPKRAPMEDLLPVTRTRMILLFGFLITLFVLILASLVFVTVVAPPVAPGAD